MTPTELHVAIIGAGTAEMNRRGPLAQPSIFAN